MAFTKTPQFMLDLQSTCAKLLQTEFGLGEQAAADAGLKISIQIADDYGGQMIYVPQSREFELTQRDQDIWHKFTGTNQAELALEYGVSLQWMYKLINQLRLLDTKRNQTDLFGNDKEAATKSRRDC